MMDTRASASAAVVAVDAAVALALKAAADDETSRELSGNAEEYAEDAEADGTSRRLVASHVAPAVSADDGITNGMRRVDERCSSEKLLRELNMSVCVFVYLNEWIVCERGVCESRGKMALRF
jgi:hypothetical protein